MPAFANCDSPSRRRIQRLRFASGKQMDVKDMKVALDIIIRPSLQLWKLGIGYGVLPSLKRPPKPVVPGDDASSTSSTTTMVRFDDRPVTISRRWFPERFRKDSNPSPTRPCLVIRELNDVSVRHKPPKPPAEEDCESIYEDCLSDYSGFLVDLQVLEGGDRLDTRSPESIRRSDFYEIESGIAMFDRAGYANYCLSRWLDKQREEARVQEKRVLEDPSPLPSHTLSPPPPASNPTDAAFPVPSIPPAAISRPPRSLPLRIWNQVEDELHNAIFVLIVGLFIHICLLLFLLYDILTRGFIPSDD